MVDWESFYGAFRKPDFIPGYEIQNHLGGGAFGEVYKARKTSIGKPYAVKFLRLDDEAQRDAIARELEQVRLFASIDHPHLVTIEDMGVVADVPYLIMGYAGEDTLARHLASADLDREKTLRYFVQACRGVLALHDRRLAHFDLKPSNVFIKGDVARVGDYGLAKLLTEGRQTLSFGRGTPQYMAPEMLRNRADHRADIYSLGVILFESLAYSLPFANESGGGAIVREEDTEPSFPEDFPEELRPIVRRCLRLDPADRYASVDELLEALGQTPRRGDSVRIPLGELSDETRELQRKSATEKGEAAETPSGGSEDLRVAAAELARGAVGVARGVWDGVVERVSPGAKAEGGPDEEVRDAEGPDEAAELANAPSSADDAGIEVVSVRTLDDPEEPAAEEGVRSTRKWSAPWRRELRRAREERKKGGGTGAASAPRAAGLAPLPPLPPLAPLTPRDAGGPPAPGIASLDPLDPPFATGAGGSGTGAPVAATVPVPPRAEGGWLGSVVQSLVVGAEIMGALVTGPVMVALRETAAFFDRILRGVPGLLGRILRFLLMLALLAVLGGLVSFVVLAAISWTL